MEKMIIDMQSENFCTILNEKTGEQWILDGNLIENKRKNYIKKCKKYLRYLERCEKGSNNAKKKEVEMHSEKGHYIRTIEHLFHCYSKEVVNLVLSQNIEYIEIRKHNKKEPRYKYDDFGSFNIESFYQKLNYKLKNANLYLNVVEEM